MTQLLTRSPETTPAVQDNYRDIGFRDSVRLHFLFRLVGTSEWQNANYTIDADVVSGPEDKEDGSQFVPYLLPDRALPEGDEYASMQPFRMDESPVTKWLPNGQAAELRYVVMQRDALNIIQLEMKTA